MIIHCDDVSGIVPNKDRAAAVAEPMVSPPATRPITEQYAEDDDPDFVSEFERVDPSSGEIYDLGDVDSMIDALERIKRLDARCYKAKVMIARSLAAKTSGEAKTRRVQGRRRKAVVELPDTNWDNSILKEAWNSFPVFSDEYLRIERIAPKLREVKKMKNTTGTTDFETFKGMVLSAEREPTANPTIKIEK